MATTADIAQWHRCEQLAKLCQVKITVRSGFEMRRKKDDTILGVVPTVSDLYHFLCGYEHFASADKARWRR